MRCTLALTSLAATFAREWDGPYFTPEELQQTFAEAAIKLENAKASSSFLSRTSWSFGQDGEVHEHGWTFDSKEDGSVMKKRAVCKDGHCTEVVEVLEPPPLPPPTFQEVQWSPRDDPLSIIGLLENMQHHQHQQQPPAVEPMRNMQPPSHLRTILAREFMIDTTNKQAEILLKPLPQERWFDSPRASMIEIEISRPTPQNGAAVQAPDMTFVKVGVAIVALGASYALVMSALNCYRMDQVSARERPLCEFAQPFAPDSVNVAILGVATHKADPVRMYLSSLYTRANAKNEVRGLTTYLARLYARISA